MERKRRGNGKDRERKSTIEKKIYERQIEKEVNRDVYVYVSINTLPSAVAHT